MIPKWGCRTCKFHCWPCHFGTYNVFPNIKDIPMKTETTLEGRTGEEAAAGQGYVCCQPSRDNSRMKRKHSKALFPIHIS